MKKYTDMSLQERQAEYAAVQAEYEKLKAMGLSLNMARGKPGKAQLDLVTPIFSLLTKPEDFVSDGIDVRNYGEVAGIPAARRHPRSAPQRKALVQAGQGQMDLPGARL